MKTVTHITTVHHWRDNRIFEKMIRSLLLNGYMVSYIAPGHSSMDDCHLDGLHLVKLPAGKSLHARLYRNLKAFYLTVRKKKGLVHFHDPEFLPFALILSLVGHKVIYDVHEDYKLSMMQKSYIPVFLRRAISTVVSMFEYLACQLFSTVIAEKSYRYRFSKAVEVLNYPVVSQYINKECKPPTDTLRLIYTGTFSEDRGIIHCLDLISRLDNARLYLYGRCSDLLLQKIRSHDAFKSNKVILNIDPVGIPFSEIQDAYEKYSWTAGLAIFPRTDHYYEKELTKLFEYMQYGIPTVCSDFPVWKSLLEDNHAGICVDPEDVNAQVNAVRLLHDNSELYSEYCHSAQSAARNRYNWNSQLDNLLQLYEGLI